MFTITITETKTITKTINDTWGIVGTREVERDCFIAEGEPRTRIEDVRGYLPPVQKEVPVTTELLVQRVEYLNINEVIIAINKL